MFQLTESEVEALRSQFVISKKEKDQKKQRVMNVEVEFVISKGRGGRRYAPHVFTELGVSMLSTVLRSERAIEVNIQIMRTFVKLRRLLSSNAALARKLANLENKYDGQFRIVFEAIKELMTPAVTKKRKIGFGRD